MTRFGYFLSSEEHDPREIVRQARLAEEAGFDGLWISDHFHPWLDAQGNSGFVWSMIGAISQACSLPVTSHLREYLDAKSITRTNRQEENDFYEFYPDKK